MWTRDKKICSIGIKIKRWVTYHGLALNINPDMRYFNNIHPCGMKGIEIGCLANYKSTVEIETIADDIINQFQLVFDVKGLGKDLSSIEPL